MNWPLKHLLGLTAFGLTASCAPSALQAEGTTYKVYFLGGQSNMEGFGYVSELQKELVNGDHNVRIFHGRNVADGGEGGGVGVWVPLTAGHGTGFVTDGISNEPSDRFGPELSFGMTMAKLHPNEHVAIIKYARGGTALVDGVSGFGSWDPAWQGGNTRNQYDNALTAISEAMRLRDIDGDGAADTLRPAGIIWMQGESDAFDDQQAATNYDANLARLMSLLRAALHDDELPIVIGQIKDSGDTPQTQVMRYSKDVRAAQKRFVENDVCAHLVTETEDFGFLPDGWHYRSQDYVALGEVFARAATRLQQDCRD
ncbi:sialate O-acetylesterase [Erythrobacter sp. HA6-11]